jgi:hypothetical protein
MKGKVSFNENVEIHSVSKNRRVVNGNTDNNKDIEMNTKKRKKRKHKLDDGFEKDGRYLETEEIENTMENEEDNSNTLDNEDLPDIEVGKEESERFNPKFLRNSFNSSDGFNALQKFVTICTENRERDLAAEYIEAGGNVLEIIKLLDKSDKKNINNTRIVFTAMHITIMK